MAVSLDTIKKARKRIRGSIYPASLMETISISSLTGLNVKLQGENLQKTGSFKIRGATNKIALLSPGEKAEGKWWISKNEKGRQDREADYRQGEHGWQSLHHQIGWIGQGISRRSPFAGAHPVTVD